MILGSTIAYLCLCILGEATLASANEYGNKNFKGGLSHVQDVNSVAQGEIAMKTRDKEDYSNAEETSMEDDFLDFLRREALKLQCNNIFSCVIIPYRFLEYIQSLNEGDISKLGSFKTDQATRFTASFLWGTTTNVGLLSRKVSAYAILFSDPLWKNQWYEQDYRTTDGPVMDHNVVPVYKLGFKGKGITIAIVDTGVVGTHADITKNYVRDLSFDYCTNQPGGEPTGEGFYRDSQGTSCAGVIVMEENNDMCGVGIAYEARVAGVTGSCPGLASADAFAKAIVHSLGDFDIYSITKVPESSSTYLKIVDESVLTEYARGVKEGREGKGAIYVQAVGNEGYEGNNCAGDGYVNRPEVIAVGSANQWGKKADTSERCTAVFTVAYSGSRQSFAGSVEGVVAPDISSTDGCMTYFSGTAASTSVASGIIALILEANPTLTYRDVMHIIAMTSEVAPLANNWNSWYKNGRGFWVSNDFGFGLLNAENMVKLADKKTWKSVPAKRVCTIVIDLKPPRDITRFKWARVPFKTYACTSDPDRAIRHLEHIEIIPVIEFPYRGDISIEMMSAAGTRSTILDRRAKDADPNGIDNWSITSVHNWGEDPRGKWLIDVKVNPWTYVMTGGYVRKLTLNLHGTLERPKHYEKPRTYAAFRLPDGKTHESS